MDCCDLRTCVLHNLPNSQNSHLPVSGDLSPHIMVATNALKVMEFIQGDGPVAEYLRNQWFINCKNSYRDDINEPGSVWNNFYLTSWTGFTVNVYFTAYCSNCSKSFCVKYKHLMYFPFSPVSVNFGTIAERVFWEKSRIITGDVTVRT